MIGALKDLDRVLRGEATGLPALREGRIEVPLLRLAVVVAVLAAVYGACMGGFALLREGGPAWMQLVATILKVPALFFLTLLITFPSLYVFNALVGSRLDVVSVGRLLTAAMGVAIAVLASLGPIEAFFAVSTTSYPFMVLLNVLIFAISGALGLAFLLQTLHRLSVSQSGVPPPADLSPATKQVLEQLPVPIPVSLPGASPSPGQSSTGAVALSQFPVPPLPPPRPAGPLERLPGQVLATHVKTVFRCWVIVFGLVGAQMGWVLRPFIGDPARPFEWFRERESNFFEAVWGALTSFFG